MSKKYFIFSDVHGFYNELMKALSEKQFNIDDPNHIIISLGDLCDRGPDAKKCIEFVLDLYNKNRAILIRGNHEDLMEEAIARHYFKEHDEHNRTIETAYQLTGLVDRGSNSDEEVLALMRTNELWNSYIKKCINYYELNDNIFVHGWIPVHLDFNDHFEYIPNWRDWTWGDEWDAARWLNGMKMWNHGIQEPNKTIWCGHWHTSWGHAYLHNDGKEWLNYIETYYIDPETGQQEPHVNYGPFKDKGIVAMDACTAVSKQVNCEVIEINN